MDIQTRDNLIAAWRNAKQALDNAIQLERTLRDQVVEACFPNAGEGTSNLDIGMGYKLKVTVKINRNLTNGEGQTDDVLDEITKLGNEGAFIAERLVGWTPKLSLTEYKKLEQSNPTHVKIKNMIDKVVTSSPGAPSLEMVPPKGQ